jgi:hypothetical protein
MAGFNKTELKCFIHLTFCLLIIFRGFSGQTAAQSADINTRLPFSEGEVLRYEGKLSKFIRGLTVADLTFTVKQSDSQAIVIDAEAKSKGTLLWLARFSFLQKVSSTINPKEFKALRTVKHDEQKDRVRESEAVFDYDQKMVKYLETDPKDPNRPPRRIASPLDGSAQDIVSGIFSLRLLPLAVGKTFNVKVSDSGLVFDVPVRVTAREVQKTEIGKLMCYRLEPEVFGPGRLIESKGSMTIWITDDSRRIPVRGVVKSRIGKIDIRIQSIGNISDKQEAMK